MHLERENNMKNNLLIRNSLLKVTLALVIQQFAFSIIYAQSLSQGEAVQTALKNNQLIKSAEYEIDFYRQTKKIGSDIGKLSAMWMHGQYNSLYQDNNLTLTQSIPFPTTLSNQIKLGKEHIIGAKKNLSAIQNELAFQVKSHYEQLLYQQAVKKLLLSQDSLYSDFVRASSLRYKTGESNLLEKTTAETQWQEVKNQLRMNDADIQIASAQVQALLKSEQAVFASEQLQKRELPIGLDSVSLQSNPDLDVLKQQVKITEQAKRVERSRVMPDLTVGYFTQSLTGRQYIDGAERDFSSSHTFQGFQLGLAIPLWVGPNLARAKAALFQEEATRKKQEHFETMLNGNYQQALRELDKNLASLNYYETSALQNAELIITQSRRAYRGGEIGYIEYLQSLKSAIAIKVNYLNSMVQYNQSIIKLSFLLGKI